MPSPPPDAYIQLWFRELNQFQASCISTDAGKLTPLLVFGNATILTYLNSTAQQSNFITAVGVKTGYKRISLDDLKTYPTFRGLLDNVHALETDIFNALQAASDPSVKKIPPMAFYKTPAKTAFPGGSTGSLWLNAQGILMASMDASCFTLAQRIKVNQIVDQDAVTTGDTPKPASTMADVIKQILVLA